MRLLVVEDEARLARALQRGLTADGFTVDVVPDGDSGLTRALEGQYDAVLLARAGLARLGRVDEATEVLDPLQMLPAPG